MAGPAGRPHGDGPARARLGVVARLLERDAVLVLGEPSLEGL